MTSHLLVKWGFLDSNLLRTFGGPKEVSFGRSLTHFKALEVRYNFPRNSLLQKMHGFFLIPKIPLECQNYQKLTSSKLIQKPHSCIFSSQTLSKLSRKYKKFRVWSFMLKIHQDSRNTIIHFWCEMTILPLVSFLHNFCSLSIFNIFLHAWILQTCPNPCF